MAQTEGTCVVEFEDFKPTQQRDVGRWLQLGVLALAISGLFAILLVLSRSPGVGEVFPWVDFFRTALVVHVDQSVLIWFISMIGVIWAATATGHGGQAWRFAAFFIALLGMLGIALSAFIGEGTPLMNNYVPVLQRPLFFLALGAFSLGALICLIRYLIDAWQSSDGISMEIAPVASLSIALICLVALFSLLWTWKQMPPELDGRAFYEYLFWGAGHTLQFAYTQALLYIWMLLVCACGVQLPGNKRLYAAILVLGALPVLLVPVIYISYPAISAEMRLAFTQLMQWGGGVAAVPIGLLLVVAMIRNRGTAASRGAIPLRNAFWMSLILFAAGGIIGVLIRDVNTVIPAHYHGSIVGVTLAMMGLAYLVMPKLGYMVIEGKMANAQPLVYGVGQILHITGLALSGALGVQRKTAGAAQGLDGLGATLTMAVMGIGGLLAVIGGILFVWVMWRGFLRGRQVA